MSHASTPPAGARQAGFELARSGRVGYLKKKVRDGSGTGTGQKISDELQNFFNTSLLLLLLVCILHLGESFDYDMKHFLKLLG